MKRIMRQLHKKKKHLHLYSHLTSDETCLDELEGDDLLLLATGRIRSLEYLPSLERKYATSDRLTIINELIKKRPVKSFFAKLMGMIRYTLNLDAKPPRITKHKPRNPYNPYHEVHFD